MANVVIAHVKKVGKSAGMKGSVRAKRMRNASGKSVRVLSLDANSATFDDDLTYVFGRNIAKARQENKKLFGSADGIRPKKK